MSESVQAPKYKMLTAADLHQFFGTAHWYSVSIFSNSIMTDGCKYVAEEADAYWLMDMIDSHLSHCNYDNIVTCKLTVDQKTGEAKLVMCDGNAKLIAKQNIRYTDFPLDEIKIWAIHNGTRYTLMLPSEY